MTVRTCTKVNVGLNVIRKRPDGYHDLETLFVPYYGFGDELSVELSSELSVTIDKDGGVDWDPMEDLTVKAWRLLKADFLSLPPVSIHLVKHAPVGAGLGGGSADAAFMLRALNELGSLGLDDAALAAYAARLGSDCAFFVYCRAMFGSGRGEILEPFDIDLSAYELRVELPLDASGRPVAVSTREAYSGIVPRDLWQSAGGLLRPTLSLRDALRLPVEQWPGLVVNDFEASVCPLHPEIPALIEDFYRRGAIYAAMSGSGSAVFGLFRK
ncbi:MAG: 4-(cytidine 5'-diphospho)-2-C-methyl-D-erythritol kinase [Bacteroidales bacterium]|nr:4-(cytidine 5'-diphospho)-2-C-methyl-D-erythritol kinase [Bacteroidales bacterium]